MFLVPDGDVDALVQALLGVVEDPERRRRPLGAGAAQRSRDYALESIRTTLEALIAVVAPSA